jgi:hypothetical protein
LNNGTVNIFPVVGLAIMRNDTLKKMIFIFFINQEFVFFIFIAAAEIVTPNIPFVIGSDPIATI